MILDILKNSGQYSNLHKLFPDAFAFLNEKDMKLPEPGKYEILGDDLFALVSEGPGKKASEAKPEAHRKYIDIQYLVSGSELIGWSPITVCNNIFSGYDEGKDIIFFNDVPEQMIKMSPGSFVILFPGDAHAPMISEGIIRKVVLKVKL